MCLTPLIIVRALFERWCAARGTPTAFPCRVEAGACRVVGLPQTHDPAYASLDTLLRHVLGAARGYMTVMCEVLELPDPEIRATPDAAALSKKPTFTWSTYWRSGARRCKNHRRRSAGEPELPVALANSLLLDAMRSTRSCTHSACVPTRRVDAQALNGCCEDRGIPAVDYLVASSPRPRFVDGVVNFLTGLLNGALLGARTGSTRD